MCREREWDCSMILYVYTVSKNDGGGIDKSRKKNRAGVRLESGHFTNVSWAAENGQKRSSSVPSKRARLPDPAEPTRRIRSFRSECWLAIAGHR